MALVVKDRVKETTTTTGTGTITLAGAVDGFQSFSAALADGDTTYYAISETSTGEWEVGLGTFTATGTTLARTTVIASSNAGSAVSLTAEADVFITQPASKSVFFDASGDLTLNQDPSSALQAATKQYVDTIAAAGIHYHTPVRVESPTNLNATYDNGTSGVGATLTNAGTQAAITIDGVALSLNDRVLVYNQTNAAHNGIYYVSTVGDGASNWVLTRATDADSYGASDPDALGEGDAFFVSEGATGAGELYVMNTSGAITFGTTNITFTVIAETAVYAAGDGLTLTGTTFAVGAGTGVTVNANDIAIGQAVGTSDSPTFAGLTTTADITFGTNDKAIFGSGSDLQIYHDGVNSKIYDSGVGNLQILGDSEIYIANAGNSEYKARFITDGAVELYYDASKKLSTASYGIDVIGNVQSDGLIVDGDATFDTNTLFVDSTNNRVGVGTILPSNALHVNSGTTNQAALFESSDATVQVAFADNSTATYFPALGAAGQDLFLKGGGSASRHMTIDSIGNVGIGVVPSATGGGYKALQLGLMTNWAFPSTGSAYRSYNLYYDGTNRKYITTGTAHEYEQSSAGHVFSTAASGTAGTNVTLSEAMRIDSSGLVGINNTSPSSMYFNNLVIGSGSGSQGITLYSGTASDGTLAFGDSTSGSERYRGYVQYGHAEDKLIFGTSATERMRIDASGNLLVGRTDTNVNTVGALIGASGYNYFTRDGGYAALFNRKTSDGEIVQFRKDGTTVGSIGTYNAAHIYFAGSNTGLKPGNNVIYATTSSGSATDNTTDIGASSYRFKDLYLSGAAYTHSIAKQTTDPIVINSTLSSSKALRVYYDMDLYNTLTFTDASWNSQGSIAGGSGNINISPNGGVVNMGGSVAMGNNTITNASGIYTNEWFRNNTSGYGLYNQATTQHFYSDDDDWWNIAGGTAANGLRFRDEYAGTVRGSVYADNTNSIGFLDAGGNWAIKHVNDAGTYFYTDNNTEEFKVGRDTVSGTYGTVQTSTTKNSWGGYSINGQYVFMSDHASAVGIYNDIDNQWMVYAARLGGVALNYSGSAKLDTTSSGVTVTGGISINDSNTQINEGTGNSVRVQTNYGYVDVGPQNTSWSHFQTDRPSFYFNKYLRAEGSIGVYNGTAYMDATYVYGDGSNLTNLPSGTSSANYVVNGYTVGYGNGNNTDGWDATGDTSATPSDALEYMKYGDVIPFDSSLSTAKGVYADIGSTTIGALQWASNSFLHSVVRYNGWSSRWITRNPTTTTNYGSLKLDSVEGLVFQCTDPSGTIVGYSLDTVFAVDGKGATCSAFNAVSDIKLKENIELIDDPVAKLQGLNGYSYNFKATGKAAYGVIAQEVEEVLPHAVTESKEVKTVDYNAIVALLVETVKKQEQRIAELEKKVGA